MPRRSRKSPVRVLVYGFGPYRGFSENITAQIIESLPARPGLRKIIFPVRFHRKQFVDALRKPMPLMVLGLGQVCAAQDRGRDQGNQSPPCQ